MNSRERVKAALYFNNPDRVPFWHMVGGDIIPLPLTYSENWRPGMNEGEERLFPHVRGYFNWDRPDWANNNPETCAIASTIRTPGIIGVPGK